MCWAENKALPNAKVSPNVIERSYFIEDRTKGGLLGCQQYAMRGLNTCVSCLHFAAREDLPVTPLFTLQM